jgi:hypothetical protein
VSEVIHVFAGEVADEDGHLYTARALGDRREDGMWVGWLEFQPRGGRGQPRRTPTETTQANVDALRYWAGGLEPVYLEGALERAITASQVRR